MVTCPKCRGKPPPCEADARHRKVPVFKDGEITGYVYCAVCAATGQVHERSALKYQISEAERSGKSADALYAKLAEVDAAGHAPPDSDEGRRAERTRHENARLTAEVKAGRARRAPGEKPRPVTTEA